MIFSKPTSTLRRAKGSLGLLGAGLLALVWVGCPRRAWAQDEGASTSGAASRTSAEAPEESAPETSSLPSDVSSFPASSPYRNLGEYDWNLVRMALEADGVEPEHAPDGMIICGIHYRPFDIFLPGEPFPLAFNKLHTTTRVSTLAAAAPIRVGDDYSALRLEDVRTELQDATIYSTVVAVPVKREEPQCIDVYVVARDLWSLRVAFEPRLSSGTVDYLAVGVEETNFLGLNDTLGLMFIMERGSWEIGPRWRSDWFMNRNIKISEELRVIFDRERGGYEGLFQNFELRRPLRNSWDRNAWYLTSSHRGGRKRVFDGSSIHQVEIEDPTSGSLYTIDERWNEMTFVAESGYTRSWGLAYKNLLTVGTFLDMRNVSPAPMDATIPDSALDAFQNERLPRGERALGLHARWDFYRNRYFYLRNYASFEVAEPYRQGLNAYGTLRYSELGLGADVRYLRFEGGVGYVQPMGESAFVSAALLQGLRFDVDGVVDRRTEGSLRLVMPPGWAGRFVARGWFRYAGNDHSNERFRLGATTGLRGYSGNADEGPHAWMANLEWRSKPVEVLSAFFGGAVFVDVGSAFGDGESLQEAPIYASVGFGFRFFIPQALARPGSIDIGFPVGGGAWRNGMPSPMISLRFGQGFSSIEQMSLDALYR